MRLYELKFEINPNDKEKFIRELGLVLSRQYSDTDYYLAGNNSKKQKFKEIDGRTILYTINYNEDTAFFEIDDEELTMDYNKIDEVKKRKVTSELKRTKEVYEWPGKSIRVAFDTVMGHDKRLFCEVYDIDEGAVFEAKGKIAEYGYKKFITETYDDFLKNHISLINVFIIVSIILVLGIITYIML